jgi:hypothetical protein
MLMSLHLIFMPDITRTSSYDESLLLVAYRAITSENVVYLSEAVFYEVLQYFLRLASSVLPRTS